MAAKRFAGMPAPTFAAEAAPTNPESRIPIPN